MVNQPMTAPKSILIVDDEPTLVFFLAQGLQEAIPHCIIDSAASGEDALGKLANQPYDLLITDLKMPGISGFHLVEQARLLYTDIRIILMTAFGSPEVEDQVAHLKIEGYLTKPFSTTKLRHIVIQILTTQEPINLLKGDPTQ